MCWCQVSSATYLGRILNQRRIQQEVELKPNETPSFGEFR